VRGNHTITTVHAGHRWAVTARSETFNTGDGTIVGWTQTNHPARVGSVTESKDFNGFITDATYDPLGRLTAVWQPTRSKSGGKTANTTTPTRSTNTPTCPAW